MKEIQLSRGQSSLIDDDDYEKVNQFKWSAHFRHHTWYGCRQVPDSTKKNGQRYQSLHRFILGVTDPKIFVDHIDGDGLDNRKSNLRLVTNKENLRNNRKTRKVRGVWQCGTVYKAMIRWNDKVHDLGNFDTPEEAQRYYKLWAIELGVLK